MALGESCKLLALNYGFYKLQVVKADLSAEETYLDCSSIIIFVVTWKADLCLLKLFQRNRFGELCSSILRKLAFEQD